MEVQNLRTKLSELYQRKENKPYIYHFALVAWTILLVFVIGLSGTLAQGTDRTGFYIMLALSVPALYITHYWLHCCMIHILPDYRMTVTDEANVITLEE